MNEFSNEFQLNAEFFVFEVDWFHLFLKFKMSNLFSGVTNEILSFVERHEKILLSSII